MIVTAGGAEGQLPETVLTIVTGEQVPPPPTGEVAQDPLPVVIVTGGSVEGTQVPPPPTGELEGQLGVSVIVIGGTTLGQEPPPLVIVLHEVSGVQLPVPTGPTGDVEEQVSIVEKLVTGTQALWD